MMVRAHAAIRRGTRILAADRLDSRGGCGGDGNPTHRTSHRLNEQCQPRQKPEIE